MFVFCKFCELSFRVSERFKFKLLIIKKIIYWPAAWILNTKIIDEYSNDTVIGYII